MTCIVFSLLELTDSEHKSTSVDEEESENKEILNKSVENVKNSIFSNENEFKKENRKNLENTSNISKISLNSFSSDNNSIHSDYFLSQEMSEPQIFSKMQKGSPTHTLTCYFNEGEQISISVYVELHNEYKIFTKDFILRLLEFFEKLSIDKSIIFINRRHKDYSK